MKKTVFLLLAGCLIAGSVSAQKKEESQPKPNEWSKWSLQLKGGIDVPMYSEGFIERNYYDPEFGVELERTFNPLFGLSLEYMYMRQTNNIYDARINQINFISPINMSNLLSPCRSWQRFSIFFSPGLGFGFGGHTAFDYQNIYESSKDLQYSLNATLGLGGEYNISNSFAVGLQGQLRWNSNDHHAPYIGDAGNKYGNGYNYYGVNLTLRYKFTGKPNIRNTSACKENIYDTKKETTFDKYTKDLQQLKKRFIQDSIQNADSIAALRKTIGDLKSCCEANKNIVSTPVAPVVPVVIKKSEEVKPVKPAAPKITLRSVYYNVGKWDLLPASYPELDKVVSFMQQNPTYKVEVGSHTDSRGSDESNLELSKKRAQSVVDYLVSKGIARDRMAAKGYGETELLNRCKNGVTCSEAEHAINRRTEFTILNASSGVVINSDLIDKPTNYDEKEVSALTPAQSQTSSTTSKAPAYVVVSSFMERGKTSMDMKALTNMGEKGEVIEKDGRIRVVVPCASVEEAKDKLVKLRSKFPGAWILK